MSKNIIITGCSRGIGFETAKIMADEGHKVIAISRNKEKLEALKKYNTHIYTCPLDLATANFNETLVPLIQDKLEGRVDVLINNAGLLVNKPFTQLTDEDIYNVYNVNVLSVFKTIRHVFPYFSPKAHIINISSMGGIQGSVKFPGLSAYSSSKSALINLTEMLAEEYKNTNYSFNCLALGAVQTEMLNEAFPGYKAPLSAKEMATYLCNFALTGNQYYNGKTLQVSISTP